MRFCILSSLLSVKDTSTGGSKYMTSSLKSKYSLISIHFAIGLFELVISTTVIQRSVKNNTRLSTKRVESIVNRSIDLSHNGLKDLD